jgi:UDP-glucose 4-epimerase
MSRCLIIGCGLIGSHAARHLADRGHDVTVFSRSCNPWLDESKRSGIPVHEGEVARSNALLAELIGASDVVVHSASSSKPPVAADDPLSDLRSTVEPALAVMSLAASYHGKRVFFASSGGTVYGNPDALPTPEDHPLRPATPYAISHVAVEQYAAFYASTRGLTTVRLRFSNVFGPGELGHGRQGIVGHWLRRSAAGLPLLVSTGLDVKRDFLYVTDAVAALALLVERSPRHGVYNVGGGATISLSEVARAVATVTGMKSEFISDPDAAVHATSNIPMTFLDSSRIAGETGWQPAVSFVDGVRRTWDWVRDELPAQELRQRAASSRSR